MKKRRYTEEEFRSAVVLSKSWSELGRRLGLAVSGSLHSSLKKYADQLGCDTSHFLGKGHWKGQSGIGKPFERTHSNEEILVEDSPFLSSQHLKRRLLKDGLLNNLCSICNIGPSWNDRELVLQLDHVNGVHNDNRIENLRILCPNCHSQTETFGNKSRK